MATATTRAPGGVPAVRGRTSAHALPLVLGLGATALAVVLAVTAARAGATAFPVRPAGLGALLLAGLVLLARGEPGLRGAGVPAGRPPGLVTAAAAGLVAYALLGAAAASAAVAPAVAPAAAPVLAGLWGAAWLPPLVATSAAALSALPVPATAGTRRPVGAALVVVLTAGLATTAATAVLQRPVEPFDGLPPAAPAAWAVTGRRR